MSPTLTLDPVNFTLPAGETLVGSGAQASWRVQGWDLMARHFVIRVSDAGATLVPASSDSVVAFDGNQVEAEGVELVDGARIAAGSACFYYWAGAPRPGRRDQVPAPPAHLVDDRWGQAYPLTRTSTAIGRDPSNVVVLRDPTASRFHAEVRREAGGYALHSMGSTGTQLNGQPFTAPRLLREGDRIEIAYAVLRFTESPLPADVSVRADPVVMDAELASKNTMQREHVSLDGVRPAPEPPRNLTLLIATALVIVAFVAALFYLLR